MFRRKGAFQRHGPGVRAAQHPAVVARGRQGGAEEGGGPPGRKAGVHERCGVQTEQLPFQLAAPGREPGDEMLVVPLGGAGNVLHGKIQFQHPGVGLGLRVGFQPVLQRGRQAEQGAEKLPGQFLQEHGALLCEERLGQGEGRRVGFGFQQAGLAGAFFGGRCGVPGGCRGFHGPAIVQKSLVCPGQGGLEAAFAPAEGPAGLGQAALDEAS